MFLYLLRTCSKRLTLLLYLMITNTKLYPVGYRFIVPTEEQLLAYGCTLVSDTWRPPEDNNTWTIGIYDTKIKKWGGKTACTIHTGGAYYDCAVGNDYITLHAEMCEVISAQQVKTYGGQIFVNGVAQTPATTKPWTAETTGVGWAFKTGGDIIYNAVGTNHHQCIEGKTPIFGKIICKDCGKDIRDF